MPPPPLATRLKAKLLLSTMIWVKETRHSSSAYKFMQRKTVMLDDYGVSFTVIWLVSLDCLNTLIMMKSETENVVLDLLGQEYLHAIIEELEEMFRMTCHMVIKIHVKFTLVVLRHDEHV